jgi:DNA gyrase/topoisomerase IV subunit A
MSDPEIETWFDLEGKNDVLISVKPLKEKQEVLLVTKEGQACRFNSEDVRAVGRNAFGVTGIRMDGKDEVVSLEVLPLENQKEQSSRRPSRLWRSLKENWRTWSASETRLFRRHRR